MILIAYGAGKTDSIEPAEATSVEPAEKPTLDKPAGDQKGDTNSDQKPDVMFYFVLAIVWSLLYGLVNGFNAW